MCYLFGLNVQHFLIRRPIILVLQMSCIMSCHAYAKTKTQISCAVTAQLIHAFVSVSQLLQSHLISPNFRLLTSVAVCITPRLEIAKTTFLVMPLKTTQHKMYLQFSRLVCLITRYLVILISLFCLENIFYENCQ